MKIESTVGAYRADLERLLRQVPDDMGIIIHTERDSMHPYAPLMIIVGREYVVVYGYPGTALRLPDS